MAAVSNPNGLTDTEVARRPPLFDGVICYEVATGQWHQIWNAGSFTRREFIPKLTLLPGERNCPWPPPPAFRKTDWKEGDRAWVRDKVEGWVVAVYGGKPTAMGNIFGLWISNDVCICGNTPAIYIPPKGAE